MRSAGGPRRLETWQLVVPRRVGLRGFGVFRRMLMIFILHLFNMPESVKGSMNFKAAPKQLTEELFPIELESRTRGGASGLEFPLRSFRGIMRLLIDHWHFDSLAQRAVSALRFFLQGGAWALPLPLCEALCAAFEPRLLGTCPKLQNTDLQRLRGSPSGRRSSRFHGVHVPKQTSIDLRARSLDVVCPGWTCLATTTSEDFLKVLLYSLAIGFNF